MTFEWPSASISSYGKKQSLICCQLALRLLSQDSQRSLPSITSAGTDGRLPAGPRIRAICIHAQSIKAPQSPSDSLHLAISTTVHVRGCNMEHGFLQTREKISKYEKLIAASLRGCDVSLRSHQRRHVPACLGLFRHRL